jgi:hypothetical protein
MTSGLVSICQGIQTLAASGIAYREKLMQAEETEFSKYSLYSKYILIKVVNNNEFFRKTWLNDGSYSRGPSSKRGTETTYSEVSQSFLQSLQANAGIISLVRRRPLPSTSFLQLTIYNIKKLSQCLSNYAKKIYGGVDV